MWRGRSPFSLVLRLLIVPMIAVLGFHYASFISVSARDPQFNGKSLCSSGAAATCAEQLMALFSGPVRAGNLTAAQAGELRSCVRPLVPYHEISPSSGCVLDDESYAVPSTRRRRRRLQESQFAMPQFSSVDDLFEVNAMLVNGGDIDGDAREKMERLAQWPPPEILQLAKRAVEFGGDPSAVLTELSPIRHSVGSLTFQNLHCVLVGL